MQIRFRARTGEILGNLTSKYIKLSELGTTPCNKYNMDKLHAVKFISKNMSLKYNKYRQIYF